MKKSIVTCPKIVRDAHNWKRMNGDTELEKRLNSYLTCAFIIPRNVPADECLSEARDIIKMVKQALGVK